MNVLLSFLLLSPTAFSAIKTHTLKETVLDKEYPAMKGPNVEEFVDLKELQGNFWVTGVKVKIENGKDLVPEHMCHSRLVVVPRENAPTVAGINGGARNNGKTPLFGISQGQMELKLPKGFGMKVDTQGGRRGLLFGTTLQNHEKDTQPRTARVSAHIEYLTDEEAQKQNLKPLYAARFVIVHKGSGHWEVPPGRHVYRTIYRPKAGGAKTARVHFMRVHLHAFATEFELYDLTANKSVWKGLAKTDLNKGKLTHVDTYSDEKGFVLDMSHKYELRSVYENSLNQDVDAMAYLTIYSDLDNVVAL